MTRFSVLAFVAVCCLAAGAADLDVDIDPGRPYDSIKTPTKVPTGGGRRDAGSEVEKPAPKPQPGGGTVTDPEEEKKKKEPPPPAPFTLPGSKVPNTADWQQHVAWTPKEDFIEWKDETPGAPVATGPKKPDEPAPPPGADIWDMSKYPPQIPYPLYTYGLTRFMQVQLHGAQVSWMERTQLLIDMGYPGYYAATAVKNEGDLKKMSIPILSAVGPMIKNPPNKPVGELTQRVYMDLLLKYPYQEGFGEFILSKPSGETLPILMKIIKTEKHPFLVRNAVFILRCFNNREIVEPLIDLLKTTKDTVIRVRCLIALARWAPPAVAKWCNDKFNPNDTFGTLALWAVGRIALGNPIDPETVERVMKAAKAGMNDPHAEWLLSVLPTLGQIARYETGPTKQKIVDLLRIMQKWAATAVKNPPSRGGSQGQGMAMKEVPDPPQVRKQMVEELIWMSLALAGEADALQWVRAAPQVHITNSVWFTEVQELIKDLK